MYIDIFVDRSGILAEILARAGVVLRLWPRFVLALGSENLGLKLAGTKRTMHNGVNAMP
jgi:hypothetical protein